MIYGINGFPSKGITSSLQVYICLIFHIICRTIYKTGSMIFWILRLIVLTCIVSHIYHVFNKSKTGHMYHHIPIFFEI
ncbi:MAG TPA: hypothetical protein DD391_03695 [Clostridiales bacterium]|nr:hypothetical protein [Clostridiales bacterium]HBL81690.1 hypothetical protein [Clostridiales bacterium]